MGGICGEWGVNKYVNKFAHFKVKRVNDLCN